MRKLFLTLPILAGLFFLAASGSALASADGAKPAGGDPAGIAVKELVNILKEAGYTEIREIEQKGVGYEVEAIDAAGKRVELQFDARSGQILRREDDEQEPDTREGDDR